MQVAIAKRKQRQCIFCAHGCRITFSTFASASAIHRVYSGEQSSYRHKSRSDNNDRPTRYFGKGLEISKSRSSGPNSGSRHFQFSPGQGEVFSRNGDRRGKGPGDELPYNHSKGISYRPLERSRNPKQLSNTKIQDADLAIQGVMVGRIERKLLGDEVLKRLNLNEKDLLDRWALFKAKVNYQLSREVKLKPPLLTRLRLAHVERSLDGLELEIKYAFFGEVIASRFSNGDVEDQERLADLRYPAEWFPSTRGFQRVFHLHVGPTNSGKTFQALKRLEEARTGLYAGPLRLLAHEVYTRLNARGQRCNLITGDDRRTADDNDDAPMTSCTVEMIPLNAPLDVAVIDEIQMIGSEDRGWAWTQAVLGVMAREVHLCGEERTIPIIKELVAACGEKLHIHKYERLSPLQMMPRSLEGKFKDLQKGDCIVCFSVATIHGLRQALEKVLKCKVAIIYGSLPPETRAAQAKLFNDPDNDYDILVASDAIGMGLNLSIKRIIFQAAHRRTSGDRVIPLTIANIKQIGGRAGRFKTAQQAVDASTTITTTTSGEEAPVTPVAAPKTLGLVTTLDKMDYPLVAKAMAGEAEPITSAGLFPPAYVVEKFGRYFPPGTPFSYLLIRLHELSRTSQRFYLCDLRQQVSIADAIEAVEGLTITDKLIFCSAPIETRKSNEPELALAFATAVAKNTPMSILDFEDVKTLDLNLLEDEYVADRDYLRRLESLHKGIIIFMWLSFRYTGIFIHRELAIHTKELIEKRIEEVLSQLSFDYEKMRKSREQAVLDMLAKEAENEQEKSLNDESIEPARIPDIDPRREELMLDALDEYGETDDTSLSHEGVDGSDTEIEEIHIQAQEMHVAVLSLHEEVQLSFANLQAMDTNSPSDNNLFEEKRSSVEVGRAGS